MIAITHLANAGFLITSPDGRILIDPLFAHMPPAIAAQTRLAAIDLILITHAHCDHFDANGIAEICHHGAPMIAGPWAVTRRLQGKINSKRVIALEPPEGEKPPASMAMEIALGRITAYRTYHSRGHNSYLVEMPHFRFFHDGDNENTRPLAASRLGRIDALFISTWQGAGWVEFIEAVSPRRWFLMHLDANELEQCRRGAYFEGLCDHVPLADRLTVLAPGEKAEMDEA